MSNTNFGSRSALLPKSSNQQLKSPIALYAIFAVLVATNVAMGLALTMGTEISQLWARTSNPVLIAYESRIMHLRLEVDRLHSQQYLQAGNLNLQLQELLQQQQVLGEQHDYIRVLVEKAEDLGLTTAAFPTQLDSTDPLTTGSIFTRRFSPSSQAAVGQVAAVQSTLNQMSTNSNFILTSLAQDAKTATTHILDQLAPLGIVPNLSAPILASVGGPFVAANTNENSSALVARANLALDNIQTFSQVRAALNAAPLHFPLPSRQNRISSSFGNRSDPFGGSSAFHSGIDYPAPTGTSVTSTGTGKVIFAGRRGGYGNLIEIDHGNGFISRYGHLSRILVQTGQQVIAGARIGKVGSTGRSTGPHLHFEIRRNQTAVNPQSFLNVSQKLAKYIS